MPNTHQSNPHRLDVAIGARIRDRRRVVGMSQQRLAEAVGVTFQQIQKYERGSNRVSFSRLMDIAHALSCSLGELAEGLDTTPSGDIEHMNALLSANGSMELLEAYAAISSRALRRALLLHARNLAELAQQPGELASQT